MLQLGYVSRRFLYDTQMDREVLMEEKMPAAGKRKYMEVLKEKFVAFKGNMKNTFICFPVTQGSIWLFTLLFVLLININDSSVMDFWEGSCSFWFSMAPAAFSRKPCTRNAGSCGCALSFISRMLFRQYFLHGWLRWIMIVCFYPGSMIRLNSIFPGI